MSSIPYMLGLPRTLFAQQTTGSSGVLLGECPNLAKAVTVAGSSPSTTPLRGPMLITSVRVSDATAAGATGARLHLYDSANASGTAPTTGNSANGGSGPRAVIPVSGTKYVDTSAPLGIRVENGIYAVAYTGDETGADSANPLNIQVTAVPIRHVTSRYMTHFGSTLPVALNSAFPHFLSVGGASVSAANGKVVTASGSVDTDGSVTTILECPNAGKAVTVAGASPSTTPLEVPLWITRFNVWGSATGMLTLYDAAPGASTTTVATISATATPTLNSSVFGEVIGPFYKGITATFRSGTGSAVCYISGEARTNR